MGKKENNEFMIIRLIDSGIELEKKVTELKAKIKILERFAHTHRN